jgi:hypothetical protein
MKVIIFVNIILGSDTIPSNSDAEEDVDAVGAGDVADRVVRRVVLLYKTVSSHFFLVSIEIYEFYFPAISSFYA